MQVDIICQWCRGTKFRVTSLPHRILLECSICRARTSRQHLGWVTTSSGQAAEGTGAFNTDSSKAVGEGWPISEHVVSPQEKTGPVLEVKITPQSQIWELELSMRADNCLREEKIETVGDLLKYSEANLLRIPRLGLKTIKEIRDVLRANGLFLSEQGIPFDWQPCFLYWSRVNSGSSQENSDTEPAEMASE